MLDDSAYELAALTISLFSKLRERPTSEEIKQRVERLNAAYELPDETLALVVAEIETSIFTSMPLGAAVLGKGTRLRWLAEKRDSITFAFWRRYEKYLLHDRSLSPNVVNTLGATLDELLEYLGDPKDSDAFFRRGLIVGDVQSGKTATYIGLCSKAADAGYKIIIILAGHTVSLRDQTQNRFDEGFAGRDSKLIGKVGGAPAPFGAAKYGKDLVVHEYTTALHDFDTQAAQIAGSPLAGLQGPALLVVKKNTTILKNLYNWLKSLNPVTDGKISSSILLIDDEADFASVNTGKEFDPRAINKGIRQLLGLFEKASYVGVTATPFANVFISPDTKSDMFGEDLFPDDYIYSLEPPSNYVGSAQVFDTELEQTIRTFDDVEAHIPLKHNKQLEVEALPDSLLRALGTFHLSNAIRDIRGEGPSHRTMLINVSPLNAVQSKVAELVDQHVKSMRDDLMLFGKLSPDEANKQSTRINALSKIYEDEFAANESANGTLWAHVLSQLYDSNRTLTIVTVNMSSRSQLNYEQHTGVGLRVIAIGGHSLSRGLTLEGLCVSYFHRNSSAYDTLLQMGRWFGYRPNYRDLCRVFMTDQAVSNYQFISEATQDLRAQFLRMKQVGATPADFGLKVRASPAGLMMTAAAKMKTAKKMMYGTVSFSTQKLEAFMMSSSEISLKSNEAAVGTLLGKLASIKRSDSVGDPILWIAQPKQLIIDLLDHYRVHPRFLSFNPSEIAEYLKGTRLHELENWDICFREGDAEEVLAHGISVKPLRRSLFKAPDDSTMFTIGELKSRRLGSGSDDLIGLSLAQRRKIEAEADEIKARGKIPRLSVMANEVRERPMLTLYLIKSQGKSERAYRPPIDPFTAISLNFNFFADADLPERHIVFANPTWQKMEESLRADLDEDDALMNEDHDS